MNTSFSKKAKVDYDLKQDRFHKQLTAILITQPLL